MKYKITTEAEARKLLVTLSVIENISPASIAEIYSGVMDSLRDNPEIEIQVIVGKEGVSIRRNVLNEEIDKLTALIMDAIPEGTSETDFISSIGKVLAFAYDTSSVTKTNMDMVFERKGFNILLSLRKVENVSSNGEDYKDASEEDDESPIYKH